MIWGRIIEEYTPCKPRFFSSCMW